MKLLIKSQIDFLQKNIPPPRDDKIIKGVKFIIPIFPYRLYVVGAIDISEDPMGAYVYRDPTEGSFLLIRGKLSMPVLVHECYHLLQDFQEFFGFKIDDNSEEIGAYLIQYLFKKTLEGARKLEMMEDV